MKTPYQEILILIGLIESKGPKLKLYANNNLQIRVFRYLVHYFIRYPSDFGRF